MVLIMFFCQQIPQVHGDIQFKKLIRDQLLDWSRLEPLEARGPTLVGFEYKRIYRLMTGELEPPRHLARDESPLHLDWLRSLSACLWFGVHIDRPVSAAVELYDRLSDSYPAWYLSPKNGKDVHDLRYRIIQLYANPQKQPLASMLDPLSATDSSLDYRVPWLLHEILFAKYGNTLLEPAAADTLHIHFAMQLEIVGRPWLAVFVLLHLSEESRRQKAVVELLSRHVPHIDFEQVETNADCQFLLSRLHVPRVWLCAALAIRARSENDLLNTVRYLMGARRFHEAHQVLLHDAVAKGERGQMAALAPSLLLSGTRENRVLLKELLQSLQDAMYGNSMEEYGADGAGESSQDWEFGGKVILSYIHLLDASEGLFVGAPRAQHELDSLTQQVQMLTSLLPNAMRLNENASSAMPSTTPLLHRCVPCPYSLLCSNSVAVGFALLA
mgnify:CR=1 FL=1